jgi:hypothetical protein
MNAGDRLGAWILTGPIGRIAAFAGDLAAALGGAALNKLRRR